MKKTVSLYPKIYSFEDAWNKANEIIITKKSTAGIRLLAGNGFSKAYYGDFGYSTLFDAIKNKKDNSRIKKVFEKFGNSNFEAVLRLLQDSSWLVKIYGLENKEILKDYGEIQKALAEAVVKVHPQHTGIIPEENKKKCLEFIGLFNDIFTINYDLLLYWVIMQQNPIDFGDYFTREEDTPGEYCEYVGNGALSPKHIYYLHGALHLFQEKGVTIKIVWGNTVPLVSQIKKLMGEGKYPLVVAEGDSLSKITQIKGNPYLKHAFDKLKLVGGQLFTFGFSMSDQDKHVINAIACNKKIKYLWIGIQGDFKKQHNKRFITLAEEIKEHRIKAVEEKQKNKNTKKDEIEIFFYDTSSMNIWGIKQ